MSRNSELDRRISVAPMMDWTDRHDRVFLRLISRRTLLYTEMIPVGAILHGARERCLGFDACENPVALQLGGAEPGELADCAQVAAEFCYDEINLNVGCPSDRVQNARFGACLMAEPARVGACVAAMAAATPIPVTVKCRIGIDARDTFEDLCAFTQVVADSGCRTLIVHARKAWLSGLSPKQNREIPPLRPEVVYRLKEHFPDLEVILNGGIEDLDRAAAHLARVDGVMIGRAAYRNPYLLAGIDSRFFGETGPAPDREAVVRALLPYVSERLSRGVPLKSIARHILGLFKGQPGARIWRRHLSTESHRPGAGPEVIETALELALAAQRARQAA
ncbi:MAG: tRNA dihydrouridine(20/20a) synthase DusA [Alphaproteobacteria bacterium]|nr:MAG: tRNA dihydrouridine(20/20a) synthase DusA [Alphaproteobacteria bacterium]